MSPTVRSINETEISAFRLALARGFGSDLEDEANDRFSAILPLPRTVAAFDGDEIVGTLGDFEFDVTVPGGAAVPMAGTTMITVRPTHRRRGILTGMMRRHFEVAAARGNALAGLWASEATIYGRFGFGPAADRHSLEFQSGSVRLPPAPPDVRIRLVEVDDAAKILPALYDRARPTRAGMLSRHQAWWAHRRFYDPVSGREGRTSRRYVVAVRGGQDVGYATYRQKEVWDDWVPNGEVGVIELIAGDDDARRALWSFLVSIDLFPKVEWWNAPVDYPLLVEADNRRLLNRKISDTLWMRMLDIGGALEARTYEADGRVTIEVADRFLPDNEGAYELVVDGGVAACRRIVGEAQVRIAADDLGSLYLGGRSAPQLAAAGRIAGSPADVTLLDTIFRTSVAPWCPEVF